MLINFVEQTSRKAREIFGVESTRGSDAAFSGYNLMGEKKKLTLNCDIPLTSDWAP